jgi:hypothetical protein
MIHQPPLILTTRGIGRHNLYDPMRAGRIRSVKDGCARFITAETLSTYVSMLETETQDAA